MGLKTHEPQEMNSKSRLPLRSLFDTLDSKRELSRDDLETLLLSFIAELSNPISVLWSAKQMFDDSGSLTREQTTELFADVSHAAEDCARSIQLVRQILDGR